MGKNVNEELSDRELGGVSGGLQKEIPIFVQCNKCGYSVRTTVERSKVEIKCPACKEGILRKGMLS